jgi:uncharacterized protein YqhQ
LSLGSFLRLAAHIQLLPVLESGEETLVGGQAVMEGVMMRAPHSYCVAVRKPSGEIVTEENMLHRVSEKYPIFKYPVLRGIGTLGQAMWLGVKALKFSANTMVEDEVKDKEGKSKEIPGWLMNANVVLSIVFFIAMYKLAPLFLTTQLQKWYPQIHGRIAFNFVDGVIRIAIFLGFLFLLSRAKDIHRVFEYHGAEHRVVFNFESGKPVSVDNAQQFVTWHPRCGTSFLVVVMVISMLIYMVLPIDSFIGRLLIRIVLLPPIVGISYEVIRFAAKRRGGLMGVLTTPGLWLQRITTQPPSNDQTDIAIHALDGAMKLEKAQGGELVIA